MKKLLTGLTGILALTLAAPALADSPNPYPRTISVSGEAKEDIAPDQAVLAMALVSKDKNLTVAKKNNDAMVDRLVQIAKEYKIPPEKLATSNVSISPEYNYAGGVQSFVGYTVGRSIRLTIDDLNIQERLLSSVVEAKIDQVNGLEFQLAEPEKHASALRIKALNDAKAKAEALATAAGAKLGVPISIETQDATIRPPRPMPMMARMAAAPESVAPSLPGMITLQENVSVVYALE